MKKSMPYLRSSLALMSALAVLSPSLTLAAYPERPITVIMPFNPGGVTDTGARTWAPYLSTCMGTSVVVVNRPGAGGDLGTTQLASSPTDGYTIGSLVVPNIVTGPIVKKMEYSLDSFTWLGAIYGSRTTLAVGLNSPYKTLKDFVDASEKKPLNVGLSAIGSDDYFAARKFQELSGAKLNLIPIGGGAAARTAMIGGHIDGASMSVADSAPFQSEIRILAVAAEQRLKDLPDTPTFRELGYDHVAGAFHAIAAPAGIPADVAAKLSSCFQNIAKDPAFIEDAAKRSLILDPLTPEQEKEKILSEDKKLRGMWQSNPWIK